MEKGKEFIVCAAIWYNDGKQYEAQPENIKDGFVICGRRHHNCYQTLAILSDFDEKIKARIIGIEAKMTPEDHRNNQGFVTSLDRYVNRREGYLIAKANNQIQYGAYATDSETAILISENLY